MGKKVTTRIAASRLGLPQKEVLRRIRLGDIPATKFDWIWVIDIEDLEEVKKTDWYKRHQALAS